MKLLIDIWRGLPYDTKVMAGAAAAYVAAIAFAVVLALTK